MRELKIEEVHSILIDILDEMACLFKKYDIPWFLSSGTLLGAVRHKGFIPWDDDVDIWIPINSFKKACAVLNKESKYKLYSLWGGEFYCFLTAKLCDMQTILEDSTQLGEIYHYKRGVAIDIFPLFGADQYQGLRKHKINFTYSMLGGHYICFHQNSSFQGSKKMRMLVKMDKILFKHDMKFWMRKFYRFLLNSKGEEVIWDYWDPNYMYRSSDFQDVVWMEFEGKQYPAPAGYDGILKKLYGNYMQLPPIEKRVSHPGKKYFIEE